MAEVFISNGVHLHPRQVPVSRCHTLAEVSVGKGVR